MGHGLEGNKPKEGEKKWEGEGARWASVWVEGREPGPGPRKGKKGKEKRKNRAGKKTLGKACKFECWTASFLVLSSSFWAIFSWSNLWEFYSIFFNFPIPTK